MPSVQTRIATTVSSAQTTITPTMSPVQTAITPIITISIKQATPTTTWTLPVGMFENLTETAIKPRETATASFAEITTKVNETVSFTETMVTLARSRNLEVEKMPQKLRLACCCQCCDDLTASYCTSCFADDVTAAMHCAIGKFTSQLTEANTQINDTSLVDASDKIELFEIDVNDFQEVIDYKTSLFDFTSEYNQLSNSNKISVGFTASDLIVDCQYAGISCSAENDFVPFLDPTLGNCYSFNSGWNVSQHLRSTAIMGRQFGSHY